MLNPNQIELIHREVDGENTPEASAQVRELVEAQPEAKALLTSLRELDTLFGQVSDRAPSASLVSSLRRVVAPKPIAQPQQSINRWAVQQWNGISTFMGELMSTKKVLLGATTAVALIAIIGYAIVVYPPSGNDAGTIGGVQKADRYRGRTLTEADITLSNPAVKQLFQNDKVLALVKSDKFRRAMHDKGFKELLASEVYHDLTNNEIYHDVSSNETFHDLTNNEVFHDLVNDQAFHDWLNKEDASHDVTHDEVLHDLTNSEVFHGELNNQAGQELLNNEAFHELLNSDAGIALLNSEAFHDILNNEVYLAVLNNEVFFDILNSDAMHDLQSSELFQNVLHDASLTEVFLNEANQAQID